MRDSHIEGAIRRILARQPADVSGTCPDANDLAAYLESRMTVGEAARFEEHAAGCAACRQALALSLQLAEPEPDLANIQVREARRSSYSTSPIRFALAAVVLLTVGVLLYQATRESQLSQMKPQMARDERTSGPAGGPAATFGVPEKSKVSPSAAAPASQMQPAGTAKTRAGDQLAAVPREAEAGRQKAPAPRTDLTVPALVRAQPQLQALADAKKQAAGDSGNAVLREKQGQLDAEELKLKNETVLAYHAKRQAAGGGQAAAIPAQAAQVNLQAAQGAPVIDQIQVGNLAVANRTQQALPETQRLPSLGNEKALEDRVQTALKQARALQQKNLTAAGFAQAIPKGAKTAADRTFLKTADYWVDAQCVSHGDAPSREITRDSKEYLDILAKEPALADLRPAGVPVLIYWGGANLMIR